MENVSEERAVKAPSLPSHISSIVQRPKEAINLWLLVAERLFYQLKTTVYLRPVRLQQKLQNYCTVSTGPAQEMPFEPLELQASQPDSCPDAACKWPHVPSFYSSIVSPRTFLWRHQGTCVCFYVWQEDLFPEALCVYFML